MRRRGLAPCDDVAGICRWTTEEAVDAREFHESSAARIADNRQQAIFRQRSVRDRLTSALVSNTPRSPTPADRISVWIQRNFGLVPVRTANVGACWRPDVEAYPSRPGSLSATSPRTNGQIRTLPEGTVQLRSNPTRTIQYDARVSRTTSHTDGHAYTSRPAAAPRLIRD